ncbi:hypothetical protein GUITHDRAFT_133030 [Guillardia theta CCMP2712]|uniref:Uncharacterized protein n=1 Tax=Guillardia theta (strain CCMP2712) TaxID=905079 RepID=L1JYY6_GUITC|nr:hypothetical protein GUITHDRAFT_133030 [Guillardia theta CCMP2712]EKX53288.1 hypothetical protein GUITHDRAFT_133030 [Guillardia theta CCMP2712]|eukprot:XP_005840268.1 hypothetical protein GUITHDRAFT_133030 [Guillardia theta CCMP2712]
MDTQKKQRIHELRQRLHASREGRRGREGQVDQDEEREQGEEEQGVQAETEEDHRSGKYDHESKTPRLRPHDVTGEERGGGDEGARNHRSLLAQQMKKQLALDQPLTSDPPRETSRAHQHSSIHSESDKKRKLQARPSEERPLTREERERMEAKHSPSLPRCLGHVAGKKAVVYSVGSLPRSASQHKTIVLPTTRGELLALATTALRLRPPAQRVFDANSGTELLDPWLQELVEDHSMQGGASWLNGAHADVSFLLAVSHHEEFAPPRLVAHDASPQHAAMVAQVPDGEAPEGGRQAVAELEERIRELEDERTKLKKQLDFKSRALAASIKREREMQEREEMLRKTVKRPPSSYLSPSADPMQVATQAEAHRLEMEELRRRLDMLEARED